MNIGFSSIWGQTNFQFSTDNIELDFDDNLFKPMFEFQQFCRQRNVNVDYVSNFDIDDIDAFVFHEVPQPNNQYFQYAQLKNKPLFLFNDEPEVVYPPSHHVWNHNPFVRVFTQHDSLITGDKYVKINPFCFDFALEPLRLAKERFCVMMNSNKTSTHPLELYSHRLKVIRWFETYHPEKFDLYGHGWDPVQFPSFKGVAKKKIDTLARYKFVICYENARDIPGYITEKIFDCFFAGSVPIYLGASNIDSYVPASCFIDGRNFNDCDELYTALKGIDEETYEQYLREARRFIQDEKSGDFSIDRFVKTMYDNLIEGISIHNSSLKTRSSIGASAVPMKQTKEMQDVGDMEYDPVFIGGAGRSGTTLLRVMLSAHPNLCSGPEFKLLPSITDIYETMSTQMQPILEAYELHHDDIRRIFSVFIASFFEKYRISSSAKRIVEKTPHNVLIMPQLASIFPNSKFIHIVRDGRDTVRSLVTMNWTDLDGNPIEYVQNVENAAKYWVNVVSQGLDDANLLILRNRVKLVKYEDLIYSPRETMADILTFLGEEWSESVLQHAKAPRRFEPLESSTMQVEKPLYSSSINRWATEFTQEEKTLFKEIAGELLIHLGYEESMDW